MLLNENEIYFDLQFATELKFFLVPKNWKSFQLMMKNQDQGLLTIFKIFKKSEQGSFIIAVVPVATESEQADNKTI